MASFNDNRVITLDFRQLSSNLTIDIYKLLIAVDEIKAEVVEEQSEDMWLLAGKCVACILREVYPG